MLARSAYRSEFGKALSAFRAAFFSAAFFSLFVNLLLLVPSIYMMQVYDRVLASNSESTLLMLTLITVFLYAIMGGLEWIRAQILIVTSARLDRLLGGRVFEALFQQSVASGGRLASVQPLNDLLQVRQFLTGSGLFAFFDAPWFPLYLGLMFLFHPWFGVTCLVSAGVLTGLALWNELATRDSLKQANQESIDANQFTQRNLRNVEIVEAMGMLPRLKTRWEARQTRMLDLQGQASAKAGIITALSKSYRVTIQSAMLGLGAYLAIQKDISPGLVIAGSILLGRALAPLDLMIANWRGFLQARDAYARLDSLLSAVPSREAPLPLPAPKGDISLDKAVVIPPGASSAVLKGLSFRIDAGSQVAIIGPSGAGKSTLARAILGLYPTSEGSIRLDGAEVRQWDREALGHYLGYLPQDVELLDGSIAENIARFGELDPERIVAAARTAGIHDIILRLPEGYSTRIAGHGQMLSAGQRQRLGLARAVFGQPRLLILDEPNSNLDQDGENALQATLASLKQQGSTVIVVTHRPSLLTHVDRILMLVDGQVALYGPRDAVLEKLQQPVNRPVPAAVLAHA